MAALTSLEKVSEVVWELPTSFKAGMRVPARLYGTRDIIEQMDAGVLEQISNVACLPGIQDYACCMPDGHWGYGFPIGGVAAMREEDGVVSPGGIGFDINCGMRLIATQLRLSDIQRHITELVDHLFRRVPTGAGTPGFLKLSDDEFRTILRSGARWCLERGYAWPEDLEQTEDQGCAADADPKAVSSRAIDRGLDQIGTLGSGNHYLEIQYIPDDGIYDANAAKTLSLFPGQVVIMFHCGSRGFGHQVASDYAESFLTGMSRFGIHVPDRQLACAPLNSPGGQAYLTAMRCAINMSFANRQMILHRIREVFTRVLGRTPEELGMRQVYDIAHNTAKWETIEGADGKSRRLLVHRKGSTRAYGPGFEDLPPVYRDLGQPVIIGGSMETGSYLLVGQPTARAAFYSTAHGAGRTMSRGRAKQLYQGRALFEHMKQRGIYVKSNSWTGLAEEAGGAYKNVDAVVASAELAGLSRRVARFVPLGNIKG